MTEETPTFNPMEMQVETNSAPTEQKSVEMVTTEPKTPIEDVQEVEAEVPVETKAEEPDELTKAAKRALDAEIKAEQAERKLKALEPKPQPLGDKPQIANFTTLEEYETAFENWVRGDAEKKFEQNQTQKQQQAEAAKIQTEVLAKEKESRAKHPDFDAVVAPIVPLIANNNLIKDFIAKNPMGTEVIYELGNNPAVLEQLLRSDMWSAGETLINMAARLKKPASVQVSNAPEPIKPVGSREVGKASLTQLATKDINGYMAKANKAELERKRRFN